MIILISSITQKCHSNILFQFRAIYIIFTHTIRITLDEAVACWFAVKPLTYLLLFNIITWSAGAMIHLSDIDEVVYSEPIQFLVIH